jgi:hypothetical protein
MPLALSNGDEASHATAEPRGYLCHRAAAPLAIDGRLDDAAWRAAPWTADFVDIEGDKGPRPPLQTRAKMLWDDEFFYVGAELREPHLWATLRQHDSVIFHDNDFEVFIDPDGDNHEYYELEINALGTTWDLLLPRPYKAGGQAIDEWEIRGIRSAVTLDGTLNDPSDTDVGWSVELAFPWKALAPRPERRAPREGEQWRVNFSRVQWRLDTNGGAYRKLPGAKESNWVWSPQHVIDMHRPEEWGYVQFTARAPGEARFVPDRSLPARRFLHRVYHAQRALRRAQKPYARTLAELGLEPPTPPLANALLETTATLFEASVELRPGDGSVETWRIRSDSLIWREPPRRR